MANHAYGCLWCKEFGEAVMLDRFERLLKTVPFSGTLPGFTSLVIRALGAEETPLLERDSRAAPLTGEGVVELAGEYLHGDCAYEVQCYWDLWAYDLATAQSKLLPQRLEIICMGEEYDEGVYNEMGHFEVDAGFEHLFTGHAGLLARTGSAARAEHPIEAAFLSQMARPEKLREYREKTCENIRRLLDWMRQIETAVPLERYRLWSEGEENFEARLDEILALR